MKKKLLIQTKIIAVALMLCLCATMGKSQTVTIPDANLVNYLQSIIPSAMNGNQMDTSSTAVTTLTTINVDGLGIADLTGIQYFDALMVLICKHNNITSIPTLPTSLTNLTCLDNLLTMLPSLPASLQILDCHENQITSLPTLPPSLTLLNCRTNSLTSLPVLPTSLSYLSCTFNNILCFPVFPSSITTWFVNNNPFTCLPNYIAAMGSDTTIYPLCSPGNPNGCPVVTGINEQAGNSEELSIYPNPTNGKIKITIGSESVVEIYNVFGKIIYSSTNNKHQTLTEIDLTKLQKGIYFVNTYDGKKIKTDKIVIQ